MKTKINRDLQLGFGLSLLVVIISAVASYISIHSLLSNAQSVNKNIIVISKLEKIISTIKDAETGQRGFLLSGDEVFLQPYNGADTKVFTAIKEVQQLIVNNPSQQQNLVILEHAAAVRFQRFEQLIRQKRDHKIISISQLKQGKNEMDNLRLIISRMEGNENALLSGFSQTQNFLNAFTPLIIVFATSLSILISVIYYFKLRGKYHENIRLRIGLEEKEELAAKRLNIVQEITSRISGGDYKTRVNATEQETLGMLGVFLNKMAGSLEFAFGNMAENEWLQNGESGLNLEMLGEKSIQNLSKSILQYLIVYTDSYLGAFYVADGQELHLNSSYALTLDPQHKISLGQGISGQCAVNQKMVRLKNIDKNSITISFSGGEISPADVVAYPICYENQTLGVIELASTSIYPERVMKFLSHAMTNIGIVLNSTQKNEAVKQLLDNTQAQARELEVRRDKLEQMNVELEAYTQKLQQSDEELRVQQEELEQSNQVLEERSHLLEERNQMILERNQEIQRKAHELERSTQYKTEFMANMSHELRTPLNSILLLSRYLSENDDANLTEEQVESANVILSSGRGLLTLIDEILDLSKIEAGKMEADYEEIHVSEITFAMQGLFAPVAKEKKLNLTIWADPDLPETIQTDQTKLEQILKNLLSNALKFTAKGAVGLKIEPWQNGSFIRFEVTDSGIGISEQDQGLIFEPFKQADGSTRRNFGGTGLGLSISRKLAELLQGEIEVKSEPGSGSTFTLIIPAKKSMLIEEDEPSRRNFYPEKTLIKEALPAVGQRIRHLSNQIPAEIKDDRNTLEEGDKLILIIEDDTVFASALLKFTHEKGYKCIVAVRGDLGLEMVHQYKPDAILLDIQLPVKDGWEVMEELKTNPATRHIPVHIMSSLEVKKESLLKGAIDFINKPLAIDQMKQLFEKLEDAMLRSPKKVLIIEDNHQHAKALSYFLETFNITAGISDNVEQSISILQKREADCVILDMGISGKSIYELLEKITQKTDIGRVPIIVFTGKHLSIAEENRILQYADSIVVKTAQSYQRVMDEIALFLHVMEGQKQAFTIGNEQANGVGLLADVLKDKTILIADDDVRNIFSLTRSFEKYKMKVITATNGREAIEQLTEHRPDVVLMDMMMPEMDGYESIRAIRQQTSYKNLPVIAITAKVMLADREACIAAGASDYISKPVDVDQLTSLLRVWLYDQNR
ncbi:response regulator [Mucilaginibacter sp.]|uniref:response regulator n=1 Tax=Mucilaginibacter sp. TaxID=1882438 RepID=UPI003AFF7463